ncbi:1,2-phenylacetyl-CoA epoxidase subunit PaaD [Sinorhizobium medicae]|uniref:Phenylacetate-CoA oxygenase subunit PaaJ n=1 Tax=Sinorhizobium medicae TaxID=110321 RepID=A0A6G1WHW3_9HYPH|nr:1,2-phenylacetyl-CoA epoxidase subunit PaaD [Sinorhizobium medicae]MBO1942650.1 phenylacetate-CoA oxygenase subunit PaaJ [Sinorhizobium medicae]MDX0403451.1 phenylacetate-CoA oxygenase subunit PaaJ [Sinorhizobium medicae]MDX0409543.1 phenylacetate-CoA oxygenase subunit PaaJ [Sinorhizobium medicae]MDX0415660.1 phenylacetate-CoA oxygenase subunit PaaJ [Sinorhizobium medicae]MDX0421642.1 phenylacetate-CoA oxygenase subunit PaaJ [Sinorhizobium medicae]
MATALRPSIEDVWNWLSHVPDPEIPIISVTDLGIIRDVAWDREALVVTVTPTYSGCPATAVINQDIERALKEKGIENVRLERRLSPAWTTDWISAEGREKLGNYGIAAPIDGTTAEGTLMERIAGLAGGAPLTVQCPRCNSGRTEKISQFGSTPCKASYRCRDCLEPFDYFKCI